MTDEMTVIPSSTPSGRRRYYPPTHSDLPSQRWRPYSDIHLERVRAHEKHDESGDSMERKHPLDSSWMTVLAEEVGEVAMAINDHRHAGEFADPVAALHEMRTELVQVAAMAVAWIDAIDLTYCQATTETTQDTHDADGIVESYVANCMNHLGHDGEHIDWSGRVRWVGSL